MRFQVLGAVGAVDQTGPLALGGPKQRTVLAMLVSNHPNPVSAGLIIEALYGDESHQNARRTVQAYVSNLRRVLGANRIERSSGGWVLSCARSDIDALFFEDGVSLVSNSKDSPTARADRLADLLKMWHGHPYADIDAHGVLVAEVARLNELRLAALCARVDADLEAGRHFEVIGELEALLASHPYDERLRGQHMLALYRSGRQMEALRSYKTVHKLLVEELGVDPGPRLQELEIQILEQSSVLDLPTRTSIESRAILVADVADPFATSIDDVAGHIEAAIETNGGFTLGPAGTAVYGSFTGSAGAINTAVALASGYADLKVGLDFGEVEVDELGVTGPPVLRCARLVAIAHPGQVLVSTPAHAAITSDGTAGVRFETLGTQRLGGIEEPIGVFQLLAGSSDDVFPPLALERVPAPTPRGAVYNPAGYELRDRIGQGPVGVLHRGYHPTTGREVMVEVIGRTEASSPGFIRRFEADAQRLSLTHHPHLLPVLDYWRDGERAYVVYGGWHGEDLTDAFADADDRILDQIASALDYAHSVGLVHGSLSPKRVALDDFGNGYLFGFPVGLRTPRSDPAYLPPHVSDPEISINRDVYAFAVLANAVSEGDPPDPDLPAMSVDTATGGAQTAAGVLDFLRTGRPGVPGESPIAPPNPFKGLAPFLESDAEHFFGRDGLVDELVTAIWNSPLVAVVGPSGVGKSSVVRAGLVPALRGGAVSGSKEWLFSDMYPSDDPFRELAPALARVAAAMPVTLTERLADQDPAALDDLSLVLPAESFLLLVVDQFEELFTLCDEETRARFIELLTRGAARGFIRVVITMRADFLDQALGHSQLGSLIRNHMVAVSAPTAAQIGEAVRGPSELVGVRVDTDLVDRIVADVHDRPGALPLMQHALASAFDARAGARLDLESYEEDGGVEGSVAHHAESVWNGLKETEQRTMRQVLLRLVAFSDDNAPMRRRARWFEFARLRADPAIALFVAERLLVSDFDPETRAPTLEVIHEALFISWPRLKAWIDEQGAAIAMARRLDVVVSEWLAAERSVDHLLVGGRLAQHLEWSTDSDLNITPMQREFLDASAAREIEQVRERRQKRALVVVGLAVVAAIAVVFGLFATRNAREAKAEALAASSRAVLDEDPELSTLLGIEALKLSPNSGRALDALHVALQSHRAVFALERPPQTVGSMSPTGDQLAVAVADDYIEVWTLEPAQEMVWGTTAEEANVVWAHFNEAGTHLYIYGDDPLTMEPGWRVVDVRTYKEVHDEFIHFDFSWCTYVSPVLGTSDGFVHEGTPIPMISYEYLPDEDDCLWGSVAGALALDPGTGQLTDFGEFSTTAVVTPTVSDNGTRYAKAAQPPRIGGVYDYASLEKVRELPPGVATLNGDGSLVLAGSDPMFLMEVDTGDVLASYPGEYSVAYFNHDETLVVGASFDGATRLFDVATGRLVHELRGPGSRPLSVQISDDDSRVSSFHGDGDVRVWDVASTMFPIGSEVMYEPTGHSVAGQTVLLSDRLFVPVLDGDGLSTAEFDRESGNLVRVLSGAVLAGAPDESFVVLARETGPFDLVNVESGAVVKVLEGPCDPVAPSSCGAYPDAWQERALSGAISPDGGFFAMGGSSGNAAVWDLASGQIVAFFPGLGLSGAGGIAGAHVEFSPDGSELAVSLVGPEGLPVLYRVDTATWEIVDELELFQPFTEIRYALDGEVVVGSDFAANVAVIDRDSWVERPSLEGQQGGSLADLDVSPDGYRMATASPSHGVWIWNLRSMSVEHRLEFPGTSVFSVEYIDDDALLVTDSRSSVVVSVDPGGLLETARQRITRSFTSMECETYDIDPCPGQPGAT